MRYRTETPKNRLRRHLGVSRHKLREDISPSEDTWASEDIFSAETFLGAQTHGPPKTLSQNTARVKTLHRVRPRAC